MKAKYLLLLLFIGVLQVAAQDVIILKDSLNFDARVLDVNKRTVNYRLYTEPEGRIHMIPTNKVAYIRYQNGSVRDLSISNSYAFKRNIFSFHLLDLLVGDFTLTYQHILANGKVGLEIPVAFGYSSERNEVPLPPPFSNINSDFHNKFYTGINLNLYPTGQGKVKYFVGPAIHFGAGYFESYTHGYEKRINTNYFRLLVNNGLMISPLPSFSLKFVVGLGLLNTFNADFNEDRDVQTTANITFGMSYRF